MMAFKPDALAFAFAPFAVSMSFTPGPNNLMLASSGARFGFGRTLPHLVGVVIGFALMTLLVGLGVAGLIASAPALYTVMKYASVAYLLYLAWRIATSETPKGRTAEARPLSFLQAAAFQWINPKAWIIALGGVSAYTEPRAAIAAQVITLTLILAVTGVASCTTWTAFGQLLRRALTTPRRRIAYNLLMAALLVGSVIPVLVER